MHEGGFTGRIVATILDELKKFPDQKVLRVKVLVGEMLHLEPESVRMHYQLLTKNSILEGVELELKQIPVTVECVRCHQDVRVEDHHRLVCGQCGSEDVKLAGGDQVFIEAIELEDPK